MKRPVGSSTVPLKGAVSKVWVQVEGMVIRGGEGMWEAKAGDG